MKKNVLLTVQLKKDDKKRKREMRDNLKEKKRITKKKAKRDNLDDIEKE